MTTWMNGNLDGSCDGKAESRAGSVAGSWSDSAASRVSLLDHGLLYGDGIFEGIRAYGGRAFRLSAHLDRFYRGAACIMLDPGIGYEALAALVSEAFVREAEKGNPDSYLRLVCTRGAGALGLDPASCPRPTLFLVCDRISLYPELYYRKGITLAAVLELAADAGHAVERRPMTLFDLYTADEVFLTGTGAELVPVREIDGRVIGGHAPVGEWTPGPVFSGLLADFRERRVDPAWA